MNSYFIMIKNFALSGIWKYILILTYICYARQISAEQTMHNVLDMRQSVPLCKLECLQGKSITVKRVIENSRQSKLLEHVQLHTVCGLDGCQFVAHPKVILKDVQMQHHTGLYKKIGNLYTPEDIAKWIAERKRLYPTKENVARRQAVQEEKLNRGERLGENKNRFGRNSVSFISSGTRGTGRGGRGRGRGRSFYARSFSHARGNSTTTGKSRKPPQLGISYEEDNSVHRKIPAFPGTAAFSEAAASDGDSGSGSDQDREQFSDAEWEAGSSVAVDDAPRDSHIPVMSRALSSLMGLYASGSSESEGENGKVVSRSVVSHTKYEPVSCKDKTFNTDTGIVDSCGPEMKAGGAGNNKNECCVTSSSKFDDSDSGPEEAPIMRESDGVQDSGNTNTCVKSQENKSTARNSRKRRRHHKPNSHKNSKSAPNEKTGSVCPERNSSNRSSYIRKRKLTLLEKLLRCEIRHERYDSAVCQIYCTEQFLYFKCQC